MLLKKQIRRRKKNPILFYDRRRVGFGKSIMLKKSPLPKGTVVIDADAIKKKLPEFNAMKAKGGKIAENAANIHMRNQVDFKIDSKRISAKKIPYNA